MPAASTRLPRLRTWKLGERERFVPAPPRLNDPVRPPPPAAAPGRATRDDDEALRVALLQRAGVTATMPAEDKGGALAGELDDLFAGADHASRKPSMKAEEAEDVALAPPPTATASVAAPAPIAPEAMVTSELARNTPVAGRTYDAVGSTAAVPMEPTEQIGLVPPPGWQAPTWDPNLPAALAGGWDLSYAALAPETIASGKGARRVALFARSWPVTAERKLYPALADDAFLVAEIKNPSSDALPGGHAQLFVGADPAGTALLAMVAPGETFTLPLGLDHAVKPVRNVKVTTVEKGIINKDEINEYVVTTEIANPYRAPLSLRVLDQIPVSDQHDVEVKLVRSEPAAQLDAVKGELGWRVTVPPQGRTSVTFTYSIKRPKGWRLHQ